MECFPRNPTSAEDFHTLMLTNKAAGFRAIEEKPFYHGIVGNTMIFIVPATREAIQEAGSTTLHLDGTYRTSPHVFAQLVMAYAEVSGKVRFFRMFQFKVNIYRSHRAQI